MSKRGSSLAVTYATNTVSEDDMADSRPTSKAKTGQIRKSTLIKRAPLKEIANTQGASDADDMDDLNGPIETYSKPSKPMDAAKATAKKTTTNSGTTKVGAGSKEGSTKGAPQEIDEIPDTQDIIAQSKLARTQATSNKRQKVSKRDARSDSRPEQMELEELISEQGELEKGALQPHTAKSNQGVFNSRKKQATLVRGRAGSASDTERGGNDPTLRRKLGEMTKKFDALELKFRDLQEIGITEAESNFDRLKRHADDKTKAANELIASLRVELAAQNSMVSASSSLMGEVSTLKSQNETLIAEKKTLTSVLQEVQSENRTLNAKLGANRATTPSAEQGSKAASNSSTGPLRTLIAGSAEAVKDAQKRQLKEDLYSDLTDLIILDIKRRESEGEDVYDCIQTGRNGTLHFHLAVSNPGPTSTGGNTASAPSTSYEDAEFQYTPFLDLSRDRDLFDILPDYLTEDICFPRANAAKFYSRIVDCLTKKVRAVDE